MLIDSVLEYHDMGFYPIPILSTLDDKKPLVKWKKYQNRQPSKEKIKTWWAKWPKAMIGLVTGQSTGIFVVDCDTQEAYEKVQEYIPENMELPVAKSPHGWHLYFRMPEDKKITIGADCIPGVDYRGNGGFIVAPPSINIHGEKYEWMVALHQKALQEPPAKLINTIILNSNSLRKDVTKEDPKICNKDVTILKSGRRDSDLFRLGIALASNNVPPNEVTKVLEILAENCDPPFPKKEIPIKINSIFNKLGRKKRNFSEEIKEWVLLQKGYFYITDVIQTLQIITKEDRINLGVILNRFSKSGIIEKHGDRRGCYRLIDKTENEMKFIEEDIYEYGIKLPFGLNDMCKLHPKNIIVVAGSKGAGKTALLLNIAKMNQHDNEVLYINSEMGDEEWTDRMKALGYAKASDIKYRTIEHHSSFHDVINGDKKIYILDYLEQHDNFYEIAKPIRQIHEKLNEGICIIGIQKKTTERLARGAEFSMEKSRLYLTLDYMEDEFCSKLIIVDAKTPKIPGGAKGLYKRIKILNGATMESMDATWRR